MVADRPVDPHLLAQVTEMSPAAMEALLADLAAELRGRGPRLRAGPGGRRLPLPEPSRPDRLRRAVRARGPERPPVVGRPRDARHRGLQAAHLPGPDRLHPRRQRRRGGAHARAARLHRRGGPRSRARARPCCSAPPTCSSSGWASTRSTTCRRSPSSCPVPTWSRRSSTACASTSTSDLDRRADDDGGDVDDPEARVRVRRADAEVGRRTTAGRLTARGRAAAEGAGPGRASAAGGCART